MAISTEARNDIVRIVVGMFNGAPGSTILSQLTNAFEAGQTRAQIATNLAKTAEYQSLYPDNNTNGEVATKLVNSLLGNLATAAVKAEAVTLLTGMLNAKNTSTPALKAAARAEVTLWALDALKNVPASDAALGAAVTALNNKVEVASYYSVDAQQNPASLAAAQDVVKDVTNTAASVTAAKGSIDGTVTAGQTFSLTASLDNLVGTDLNDTFIAAPVDKSDTLQIFDSINGGAGTDTLNIYAVGEDNISQVGTVTGVEIINIYNTLADIEFGDSAVDASKFVGSQQVWQIDGANSIKDLAGTQTAGFRGEGVDDFTVTASGAEANIAFDGAKRVGSSGAIDFIVAGTKLSTVNLSGAFASASTAATTEITSGTNVTSLTVNSSLSAKNTLTIKDAADSAGGDKLTTLNLNIAKDSTVTVTDLNNLVSVNASASTGGIKLITAAPSVNSISTGSGNDEVSLATAFNGTVVSASVSTGSGNDKITVGTTGTGRVTVDAGSGTDTINLTSEVLTADDTIDGGAGDDTALILGSVGERTAENLVILRNNIINVETLAFVSSEGEDTNAFDASSLKNVFTKLAFVGTTSDSFVENISTETILVVDGANVDLTAKDYDAAEDIFGGDLDVVVTTDGYKANEDSASVPYVVYSKVTAQGEDLALNVLANSSKESSRGESSNNGTPISALLAVEIEGDVRTATINLSSSVNTPVGGAADSINVALVDINTESSTNPTGSLTALTSITLAGNGIAFVQNENGSKLASVSALGLSSTIGSFYKFNDYDAAVLFGETLEAGLARSVYGGDYVAGDKSFGLIYNTENAGIAETITLGSSVDIIKFNNGSTFAKMDKVIGLNLELNKAGTALSNQSDGIFVVGSGFTGSNVDFAKLSSIELASIAQKAGNNLELYLTEVAKLNQDEVVFHLNGNTYVFVDYGDDVLESTDQVIELVGSINLDTLLVSLNNPSGGV